MTLAPPEATGKSFKSYAQYADSGLEGLGSIPEHWTMKKLKYIASLRFSNVDKKSEDHEEPVQLCNYTDVYYNEVITPELPFMEATATEAEKRNFTLRQGDVLITKDSESWDDIAIPAYVSADMPGVLCGYHLAQIRALQSLMDGRYLFRAFVANGIQDQFNVAANGITRYGMSQQSIASALFPVPPLDEQQAIVAFLDRETARIDAMIEKKERLIALLEEKRTALISHAVTKGLDPTAPMKDSGIPTIGQVPAHWKVERCKSVFQEVDHRSVTGEEELLTVSHITGVTPRSEKNVGMFMAESLVGYKKCQENDLLINTMWAWMGALGISKYTGVVSPSYNVYRLRHGHALPDFLHLYFRTPQFKVEINRYSKGIWSSRLRLYPDEFLNMLVLIPPKSEQQAIVESVKASTSQYGVFINKLTESIAYLKEYRSAIVSAAVTGKIDVREARTVDMEGGRSIGPEKR